MRHWRKKPWVDSDVRNWDYVAEHLLPEASSEESGKTLIVSEDGGWELGEVSGGGIDFSDIKQPYDLNNIGSLFTAFEDGTWDWLEYSCLSGTNPIEIDFGRDILGMIFYPKNLKMLSELAHNANDVIGINFNAPEDEEGHQDMIWAVEKHYDGQGGSIMNRCASISLDNGILTIAPSFPANATYHPLGFNTPYLFIYWWEA